MYLSGIPAEQWTEANELLKEAARRTEAEKKGTPFDWKSFLTAENVSLLANTLGTSIENARAILRKGSPSGLEGLKSTGTMVTPPPEPKKEFPWLLVVGGVGLVGLVAVIAVVAMKK